MEKNFKTFFVVLTLLVGLFALVGCENKMEQNSKDSNGMSQQTNKKSDEKGSAGSNMPLKDNHDEAEYQIKVAMQYLLEEAYGDKVYDARIYVEKIYSYEDEQENEALKEMKLGPNEVAFEVKYEIKPANGVDPMMFTAGTGEYDEESGWVINKFNLGILRPVDKGEQKYEITNFGTGW